MATLGPRTPVQAPRFVAWRPGLVRATRAAQTYFESPVAANADDPDSQTTVTPLDRWANGISYRPNRPFAILNEDDEFVQLPGSYIGACAVGAELDQPPKTNEPGPGVVEWDPYILYDSDNCTTLSSDYAEARDRAELSLAVQTSHLLENALWTGEVNGIDFTAEHPNTALASADAFLPNGTTPLGLVSALSLMIEALSDFIGGAQAMIHVPAKAIPFNTFYGQLNRIESANYLNAGDHIIVTGTGYPGTNPDGDDDGNVWIYGTSFVEVRLSGIFPDPTERNLYSSVDRDTNSIAVRAERLALASWDRTAHIGIPVCVPDPGPDCDGGST